VGNRTGQSLGSSVIELGSTPKKERNKQPVDVKNGRMRHDSSRLAMVLVGHVLDLLESCGILVLDLLESILVVGLTAYKRDLDTNEKV